MRRLAFVVVITVGCGASGPWDPNEGDDAGKNPQPTTDASQPLKDSGVATPDAGDISDAATADDTNYNTPSVCTSNQYWTLGNTKSASMQPGVACRSCHVTFGTAGSKDFDISGTVYPTAHEPDNCNGIGGTTVVITDANNKDHVLSVNAVGNFYNDDALGFLKIPTPYTAKVVSGSNVRPMISSQTNGDCNSCHTENGTQAAPGRIMAP